MSAPLRVAITGGGIAGLASAIFLARDGHRVDLFERMPNLAPSGTGILLQPAGIDVLRRLDLAHTAFGVGSPIERILARRTDDTALMDLRYSDLRPELKALGIRRPALARVLLDAAQAAGAAVHSGIAIDALHDRDGVTLIDRESDHHGPFDLALVCDGTHSRLRDHVAPGANVRIDPRGVFSVVAPLPKASAANVLLQRLNGMRDAVGFLPIGNAGGDAPLVSFFWNALSDDLPELEGHGYDAWCDYIESFCPEALEFLRALGNFEALTWSTFAEVRMRRWHGECTLVMGDAAHALNPQLGLGATMALLDAECLSQSLRRCAGNVRATLAAYQSRRKPQVDRYSRLSRLWSRLDGSGLSPLRRRLFLAAANGPRGLRRRLLRHVCGYR